MKFRLDNKTYNEYNVSTFGRSLGIFIIPILFLFMVFYPIIVFLVIFYNSIEHFYKELKYNYDFKGFFMLVINITKEFLK